MFVLAHISDPHIPPIPNPRWRELLNKRLLGYANWRARRHRHHRADVLAAITRDIIAAGADHIAVTGDLVNIALEGEIAPARAWLSSLGSPASVTFVPGNHDAYVRATAPHALAAWADYMRGDEAGPCSAPAFPFVRRRGPVALIGLSTAVPTPPLMATGALGAAQIARAADILERLGREPVFRIVLIHHPPLSVKGARHKRLIDAPAFRDMLKRCGAELVLHGHDHLRARVQLDGPAGSIPAIGAPSASAADDGKDDPAGYTLIRIDGNPPAWRCESVARGLQPDGTVGETGRAILHGGGASG